MPARIPVAVPVALALLLAAPAWAAPKSEAVPAKSPADWQTVATEAGRTVELDKGRIDRLKGGKTAAWTRLTLDHAVLDFENQLRYTAVQALNHYDCAKNTFATQQRVFLHSGQEMKWEKVSGPQLAAKPGSLDARLLEEVCQPRTADERRQAAAQAAAAQESRPRAMHAEMVSAADAVQPHGAKKVADTPAAPKAAAAPAVAEKPADKPRLFERPLIDKSKAEDPFKGGTPAPTPAAKPVAPPAPVPATPPVAQATRPAPKLTVPVLPPQVQELTRQQRELMLATSGPRKAAPPKKEKPAEPPAPDYSHVHWGYAGPGAPENWAKLKGEYATCGAGRRQSPIDIRGGIRVDLEPIRFDYKPTQFRITDNGHTVQVDVADGNAITVMGRTYTLTQFHFHRPAEERVNGKTYDMVAHLVHKDFDGRLAVIAVLMDRGMEHPLIQTLWNHMPLEVGMDVSPPGVAIDLMQLLPEKREYYTYMGSLTTPPCTENVLWMVFKEPIRVSSEQIGIFARLYPHNARPIQPAHDRLIKESR